MAYAWVRIGAQLEPHEALSAAEEAALIYRQLAKEMPGVFTQTLRGVLETMGELLKEHGRDGEAELRRQLEEATEAQNDPLGLPPRSG